ncbi:rhodanese-like domain-containing protein [Candidatus Latescibacterota bacterium]
MKTQPITTSALAELISDGDAAVLDCRPSAAYNGWPLRGEPRGGHIPGAVSFPAEWFGSLGEEKTGEFFAKKEFARDITIVVTGYGASDMETAAENLAALGFGPVRIHDVGMTGWLSDPVMPARTLPRFRNLVYPAWITSLLNGEPIFGETGEDGKIGKYVLAHVSFDNWGDYDLGHIPGAIWMDTLILEDENTWNRRTPEELEEELCAHGITKDTCVVLYGRTANPNMSQEHPGKEAGQIGSMRAAMILKYAGVQDVRVLDGGLASWIRAGGDIAREETLPEPVESTGMNIPECPEFIVDMDEAKEMLADPGSELVSMRSWPEFIGDVSGYHYVGPKGRIPGAVFGNCGSDAYHMENYRNHDDTMRSYHDIAADWRKIGITPEKHIAFYCGTGWRASEAFYYARLMGWDNVSVYDGGWYEWSADPDNPTGQGIPPSSAG